MTIKREAWRRRAARTFKIMLGAHLTRQEQKALLFIVGLLVLGAFVKWLHRTPLP